MSELSAALSKSDANIPAWYLPAPELPGGAGFGDNCKDCSTTLHRGFIFNPLVTLDQRTSLMGKYSLSFPVLAHSRRPELLLFSCFTNHLTSWA